MSSTAPPLDREPWPSVLMRLIGEVRGDSWHPVMQRIRTHPEEVLHNFFGGTSLHAACNRYAPLHVVQALLAAAPEAAMRQQDKGESALHCATVGSSEEVQLAVLQCSPGCVQLQDHYGDTPLHLAAKSGVSLRTLQAMVNVSPETAIHCANKRGVVPLWFLSRSYRAATSIDELNGDGEFADEWEAVALFLIASSPGEPSIAHMAAATPACPREFWNVLVRLFPPELGVTSNSRGRTPLSLVSQVPIVREPENWQESEDGFYEDGVMEEVANLPRMHLDEEDLRGFAHLEETLAHDGADGDVDEASLIRLVLHWSPYAASMTDVDGRLPLTHAICSNKTWGGGIRDLLWAAPRALDTRDPITGLYPFQLSLLYTRDLDTVYNLIRSLPEHLGRVVMSLEQASGL